MPVTNWLLPKAVAQDDSIYAYDANFLLRNAVALTRGVKPAYPYLEANASSSLPEEDYMCTPGAYATPYPYLHDVRVVRRSAMVGSNLQASNMALSNAYGQAGNTIVSNSTNGVDGSSDYARVTALNSSTISWDHSYDHGVRNTTRDTSNPGSVKVTNTTAPVAVRMFGTNEASPESGVKHFAEVWVLCTTAQNFRLYDPVNNNFDTGYTLPVPANTWTKLQVEFTGAATYASVAVAVNVSTAVFYADEATIRRTGIYSKSITISDSLTEVRRQDYGIAVEFYVQQNSWKGGADNEFYTEHIKLTGLQPDIPDGATVTGMEVRMQVADHIMFQPPGYPRLFGFYNMYVRYTFTYDLKLDGLGQSDGHIKINQQPEPKIDMKRNYQYMTYEKGVFMGEWTDVASEPDTLVAVNSFPGEMNVSLNRTPFSKQSDTDGWQLVADTTPEEFDIDTGESMLVTTEARQAFGAGTDLNANHDVDIIEYYGGYENLILDNGEELVTDELEPFAEMVGFPLGRLHFRGYVSKYKKKYRNPRQGTDVTLLSHADEWNNIVYETSDVAVQSNNSTTTKLGGLGHYPSSQFTTVLGALGQSFQVTSATELAGVKLYVKGWNALDDPQAFYPTLYVSIIAGVPGAGGAVLGSGSVPVPPTAGWVSVSIEDIDLAASTTYSIIVTTDQVASGYAPDPVIVYQGSAYASGSAYSMTSSNVGKGGDGTWSVMSGLDMAFQVMKRGGQTSVLEASQDPSVMALHIVDYGKSRGSRLIYTPTSIVPSNTTVTARFNVNTLKEAMDGVLKYLPTDWFWWFDQAQLALYVQPRPTTVSQVFELGGDIEYLDLEYSIEQLVNEVYFTGGTKTDNTTLFRHYIDQDSQNEWRRGLSKSSDQRVTTDDSADIIVGAAIARGNEPIYVGELSVIRDEHVDFVVPGQLAGFTGFLDDTNLLHLQIMQVKVTRYRYICSLGILPPKTSKRLEDLKRNLETLETENNPVSPT